MENRVLCKVCRCKLVEHRGCLVTGQRLPPPWKLRHSLWRRKSPPHSPRKKHIEKSAAAAWTKHCLCAVAAIFVAWRRTAGNQTASNTTLFFIYPEYTMKFSGWFLRKGFWFIQSIRCLSFLKKKLRCHLELQLLCLISISDAKYSSN